MRMARSSPAILGATQRLPVGHLAIRIGCLPQVWAPATCGAVGLFKWRRDPQSSRRRAMRCDATRARRPMSPDLNLWLNKIDRAGVAMVNGLVRYPWAGCRW